MSLNHFDPHFPLYRPEDEHDGCGVGFLADEEGRFRPDLLPRALAALENLKHRGAVGADARTGDGAGVLLALPQEFFANRLAEVGPRPTGPVGVGVFFWPRSQPAAQRRGREIVAEILRRRGITQFCWRPVPIRPEILGVKAAATRPHIEHLIVGFDEDADRLIADRILYAARREFEARSRAENIDAYVASMSARTIVYKGLMMADSVPAFYPDLEEGWETNFAIFHQRFSTNTFPSWQLAQPFRMLGHNGEINTILGNANGTRVREDDLQSEHWNGDLKYIRPVLQDGGSDSALLDNVAELLTLSGRELTHVMPMLIPEAWEQNSKMSDAVKAFFEYHSCVNEPWDGPAAVVYSDGDLVGAHLDRNGLRPLRYQRTDDGVICASSEVGVLDISPSKIVERGRLGPGQMLAVDLQNGGVLTGDIIKEDLASRAPYREWLDEHIVHIKHDPHVAGAAPTLGDDREAFLRRQLAFGYSREEIKFLFDPMTQSGKEPISSMGNDTPISVLSRMPRLLATYFKQRFAQVTNPPIDPIREKAVMSLSVHLGKRRNWLAEIPKHARKIELAGPVLTDAEMQRVREEVRDEFRARIDCTFPVVHGAAGLKPHLQKLNQQAEDAVDDGCEVLILSDKKIDADHAPIPILMALGSISTHLLSVGKRLHTSIVVESGEPRDVHHMATLIGYGASAVYPYLALETITRECAEDTEKIERHVDNFITALDAGLLKIMSKMGISVLGSYRGAQIFEVVGLSKELIDDCFPNTPSPLGGVGYDDLAAEALQRHLRAFGPEQPSRLEDLGYFRYRRGGESHAWGPKLLGAMNKFRKGKEGAYEKFSQASRAESPLHLRDLLEFEPLGDPIPLSEVESREEIRRRFTTAAMSLGSLSPEAHEALAIAMNRIGGKSNTGEGGEDPARYVIRENGDNAEAMIKQVASGRFGVNAQYLSRARELEIKMAQGSKPGEGGQLPGHKVTPYIAYLRHATPGVPLISPPPHHDIYSIEDLAQLIYDLKVVNPAADICVKLVSESGVGTIAAGVAKAHADVILISGHDGGTGASPLSSIKNAGNTWEIGLAETQQVLRKNGLRERVRLRVDGGMKTGRDIVVAAILGAEEFNFGTAALIALGCRYVRQCHLDTCPVGIATQREDLRAKYEGDPANVVAYFDSVADEIRQILASLGARSLQEIIGQTQALKAAPVDDHPKAALLDLQPLLAPPLPRHGATFCTWPHNIRPVCDLNDRLVDDTAASLASGDRFEGRYLIGNGDRTTGARLAGAIARRHGKEGLPDDSIRLYFEGVAGQSFGAFATSGMTLILDGESNDYVGKGLSGGRLVIRHPFPADSSYRGDILVGNTVLYGATGGEFFVSGQGGERFAVRNSGALAVVEGVGDHGCEYMTSGTVVVLGKTGTNFGAGMTGGQAFVYDPQGNFPRNHHPDFIVLERLTPDTEAEVLKDHIENHVRWTDSRLGRSLLDNWEASRGAFWKVTPRALLKRSTTTEPEAPDMPLDATSPTSSRS